VKVFLDTSALAKRYVAEQGSDQVLAVCQRADSLVISVICLPELISTLCRLVREEKLASAAYRALKGGMMANLADVDICEITQEVLASVVSLLELHPLRAMDGLHVACALASAPDAFVSADHRQISAARKAGLSVIDVS
jgi:predicted nucleic acid-binding protein